MFGNTYIVNIYCFERKIKNSMKEAHNFISMITTKIVNDTPKKWFLSYLNHID